MGTIISIHFLLMGMVMVMAVEFTTLEIHFFKNGCINNQVILLFFL